MARNRALGSPYQTERVSVAFTTTFGVDEYLIEAVPLVVTLDPYAVNHDQVVIQDSTLDAAANPIVINASEGQTINGFGASLPLDVDGGSIQLTFRDGIWVPWQSGLGGVGTTGVSGSVGATGATGTAIGGITGATGAAGTVGATGVGTVGATGLSTAGATGFGGGAVGHTGATGVAGATGATGASGAGATGATGAAGLVSSGYFTGGATLTTSSASVIGGEQVMTVLAGQKAIILGTLFSIGGTAATGTLQIFVYNGGSPSSPANSPITFATYEAPVDTNATVQCEVNGPLDHVDLQASASVNGMTATADLQYWIVTA